MHFLLYFQDMTGLSQETFEPLQTQNYGIGGHYDGHWDCYMKFDTPFENGNRIATVLFYVSDKLEIRNYFYCRL